MQNLAKYACHAIYSKGRKYNENENRDEIYLKDRQKVIHSSAFRRLEYKTQVFVNHVGDHYRTRLTHSIEVSQIARIIARRLNLNEDLADTIALSHDLGHPPFGHAGEQSLDEAARNFGGFDHNTHTIKILVELEKRCSNYNGLNLSLETLEGIAKHNGPLNDDNSKVSLDIKNLLKGYDINFNTHASLEAQCAALADDIAYISHDIDDGLRAKMFSLQELENIPIIDKIFLDLKKINTKPNLFKYELIQRLSDAMVDDLMINTSLNIKKFNIESYSDVVNNKTELVIFSNEMLKTKNSLKTFLMDKVYRNYKVNRMSEKAKDLITKLFDRYLESPHCLPTQWYAKIDDLKDKNQIANCVIGYIAGMTDRFAIKEYKKLFDPSFI